MGALTSLFGGGNGPAKGAAGAAVNVAGSDILPQAGNLYTQGTGLFGMSQSELNQYLGQIEGALSTDPSVRMESIAPQVADITAATQGAKASIANQPRSGAQASELAQVDQGASTQIGNALSTAFTTAQKELGQLGMFEQEAGLSAEQQAMSSESNAASIDLNAANAYMGVTNQQAQGSQASMEQMAQMAMMIAAA